MPQPLRYRHHEGMAEYGPSIMARVAVHNPLPFTFTEAMAQTQPTGSDRWAISFLNESVRRDVDGRLRLR